MASLLNYAPVPLAFGTSGLRGLVKDITDLEAYINVKGALRYLLSIGDIRVSSRVVIAGDLRPSTDRIMCACAQAIVDSDCQVENAGKIPTPALVSHAISTGRAGVMVTGSHIPFDRNGIKINKSVGEVLKSDEPGISREVERVRVEEYSRTATTSAFDASGMLKLSPDLPPLDRVAEEAYVRRYLTSFTPGGLSSACAFLCISIRRWAAISCHRYWASSAPRWSPPGAARRSFPSTRRTSPTSRSIVWRNSPSLPKTAAGRFTQSCPRMATPTGRS
jgi:Phosphoglucomutase/phosphomannomutase, alpha/beta/alpha domain I